MPSITPSLWFDHNLEGDNVALVCGGDVWVGQLGQDGDHLIGGGDSVRVSRCGRSD